MSDPTPKQAAWAWVQREFDPDGFQTRMRELLGEVESARTAERTAYREMQLAEAAAQEAEAEVGAMVYADPDLKNAEARAAECRKRMGRDQKVQAARAKLRDKQSNHDTCLAAFEHAERQFKAARTCGDLSASVLRFLGSV
ncbi:MAG: hypothetical protein AMXMBFR33_35710 [Candidatus Xenobia bacterium]